ncbi:MAG: hypothetical protein ACD_71C00127G0002 [uncultured bacterium (gcode 4)]|uniref:Lipoprotein n=1 Tax=uncultured bacterium (gcode 4) TaxID=1234023 RepID=K2A368_9BACT|nr:MAG: hypothetical protein ACD_71C00127G0002 [uncultured bacterium (gcode 4)]
MKKLFVPAMIIATLLLTSCGTTSVTTPENTSTTQTQDTLSTQPERKVDMYGKITSMEWNEITLLEVDTSKDPTFAMTSEEKKKYMQSMDEAARMALKEQINSATLWEKKVTIPVGIPMIKKTAQWPDAPNVEASLADLKNGQYISVWLSQEVPDTKIAEFVKIAFTQ